MIYSFSYKGDIVKIVPSHTSTQSSTNLNIFIFKSKARIQIKHSKSILYITNSSNTFIALVPFKIESVNSAKLFYKNVFNNLVKFRRIKTPKTYSVKFIIQGLGLNISVINKTFLKISINTSFSFFIFIPSSICVKSFNMNKGVFIKSFNKNAIEELSKSITILYKFSIYNSKGIIYQNLS
ncbi:hypothetical protein AB834_03810 [PVC group bacterium (ex Bugula neritina AB1)]|nr:hypothetical protein AB834_03810 [PVC group bacterium (ex Bugula neritina AB1)]